MLLLAREAPLVHALHVSTSQQSQHDLNIYRTISLKSRAELQASWRNFSISQQETSAFNSV